MIEQGRTMSGLSWPDIYNRFAAQGVEAGMDKDRVWQPNGTAEGCLRIVEVMDNLGNQPVNHPAAHAFAALYAHFRTAYLTLGAKGHGVHASYVAQIRNVYEQLLALIIPDHAVFPSEEAVFKQVRRLVVFANPAMPRYKYVVYRDLLNATAVRRGEIYRMKSDFRVPDLIGYCQSKMPYSWHLWSDEQRAEICQAVIDVLLCCLPDNFVEGEYEQYA